MSSLDFPLLPCPSSSLLISTGLNFTSIHTRKIKRDLIPKEVWIMHASVLMVTKPQVHGIHALSVVQHWNSKNVFSKIKGERCIAGTWGCRAWHLSTPPITLAIAGKLNPVACALAILNTSLQGRERIPKELSKAIQHFQEAPSNYAHSAGRHGAFPCSPATLADELLIIEKSGQILKSASGKKPDYENLSPTLYGEIPAPHRFAQDVSPTATKQVK